MSQLNPSGRLTIAYCEDDAAISRLLDEALSSAGHETVFARSGAQAVQRFVGDARIDVIILDIGLPDMDGRDLCRLLRANGQQAPVLFLSALGQVHDVVHGFAAGGLDYVVKPFAVPELMARVGALARRNTPPEPVAGLHLDAQRFALCRDGQRRVLTPTEFRLAAELLAHSGQLVRRSDLIDAGWIPGARVNGNTLDTYLHRLRRHIKDLGSDVEISTVRGVGYILQSE